MKYNELLHDNLCLLGVECEPSKIVFRHQNNGLRMGRSNHIAIDCFVSLDWCFLEKLEKGHSSQFYELFLMVWLFSFIRNNCQGPSQVQKFFSWMKTSRIKHRITPGNFDFADIWWPCIKTCLWWYGTLWHQISCFPHKPQYFNTNLPY